MAAINPIDVDPEKTVTTVKHIDNADDAALKAEATLDASALGQGVSGYETLTLWQTVKKFKVNTFICFMVTFSAATDGYQIGMNGNIIANPGFVKQFATQTTADGQPSLASPILSGWSSIMSVGQIIGMTTLPFISNRYGRKVAMYWYWLILACSVLCESVARSWPVWLVGKLLAGMGVGCLQSTVPTYVSEVAPIRIRGGLLMSYSFWFALGIFFAPVALQVMGQEDPHNFRVPIYTQWAQIGLMLFIYVLIPESPAWCASQGKDAQAKKELLRINYGVKDYDVEQQFKLLAMTVEHERAVAAEQRREKWYAIFRGVDGFRTIVALWSLLSQQFIGLTLFSTFGTYFFQQAGLEDPFRITCITTSIGLATIIFIILSSDRWGRRWIACYGTTIAWVSCVAIGILGVSPKVKASDYLLVLFACFWNIGCTLNGAAGWASIGEISSQRLRPYTAGFGAATTCVAGVVMNVLTPYMVNSNQWNWGLKTGWFYAGVGLPFTVGIWFLIPETANRSAAELDELFERKIKPWRFRETETATARVVKIQKTLKN